MTVDEALHELKKYSTLKQLESLEHFGIKSKEVMGVRTPEIRQVAKLIKKDHALAQELWKTKILEARILATFIEDVKQITPQQMERWAKDIDNWALCDAACFQLFDASEHATEKIFEWSACKEEFVKRGAFAMIAGKAVHDKKAPDEIFLPFFPLIEAAAADEKFYVKKAVNWALRQIGKRNTVLHKKAVALAEKISKQKSTSAKWIAADALRELKSDNVNVRGKKKRVLKN